MNYEGVHVCKPTGQHFRAFAQNRGERKHLWSWLGPKRKSEADALKDLARYAAREDFRNGAVMLCTDWYDPIPTHILRVATRKDY